MKLEPRRPPWKIGDSRVMAYIDGLLAIGLSKERVAELMDSQNEDNINAILVAGVDVERLK